MLLTNKLHVGFGHLGVHVKNQVTYTLSGFEQNPTKGFLSKGFPNLIRRIKSKFLGIAIPFAVYYSIYRWHLIVEEKAIRKNPKDYENDV